MMRFFAVPPASRFARPRFAASGVSCLAFRARVSCPPEPRQMLPRADQRRTASGRSQFILFIFCCSRLIVFRLKYVVRERLEREETFAFAQLEASRPRSADVVLFTSSDNSHYVSQSSFSLRSMNIIRNYQTPLRRFAQFRLRIETHQANPNQTKRFSLSACLADFCAPSSR